MQKNSISLCAAILAAFTLSCTSNTQPVSKTAVKDTVPALAQNDPQPATTQLDTAAYQRLEQYLANGDSSGRWPVKSPLPTAGAVLPFNRVVAYYGNLYSNRMGALGKWPKREMIPKLLAEVKKWNEADSVI